MAAARGHLADMVSAFRALAHLGAVNVGIVPVPSLDPDHLHVSLDVGSAENLRRLARELGASEPEAFGCDGRTWLGSDLRLGSTTVRLTSEHLRAEACANCSRPFVEHLLDSCPPNPATTTMDLVVSPYHETPRGAL